MSIGPNVSPDEFVENDEDSEVEDEEQTTEQPEGTEDSESASEEGDGDDQFTTFDIEQVPEEYREHVARLQKQLQGDYTRKTQGLADQRKALEAERGTVDLAKEIINSPEMARFIALRDAGKLSGETEAPDELDELREQADPEVAKFIEKAIEKGVEERTRPFQKGLAKINALIFAASTPDWKDHYEDIQKAMKADPSLTLEAAYKEVKGEKAPLLSAENAKLKRELEKLRNDAKKAGTTEKPGPPKAPTKKAAAKSWADAVAQAVEELGEPTTDDPLFGTEG